MRLNIPWLQTAPAASRPTALVRDLLSLAASRSGGPGRMAAPRTSKMDVIDAKRAIKAKDISKPTNAITQKEKLRILVHVVGLSRPLPTSG